MRPGQPAHSRGGGECGAPDQHQALASHLHTPRGRCRGARRRCDRPMCGMLAISALTRAVRPPAGLGPARVGRRHAGDCLGAAPAEHLVRPPLSFCLCLFVSRVLSEQRQRRRCAALSVRSASALTLSEGPAVRASSVGDACVWEVEMVPDTRKTNFSRWVGLLVHTGAAQHARMQPQAPGVQALV